MPYLKPLFALTLFLSAFLLFSVQPMIGKALLPLMGGSPSVWNTAMVFFQLLLLAGYLYAFMLSKLKSLKMQGAIHAGVVILAAAISLPLEFIGADHVSLASPVSWQLAAMTVMIGAPFFVLAASAPLLQRWFSLSPDKQASSPYSLYVASNAGSLLALLAYPVLVERFFRLGEQAVGWTAGYGFLALLVGLAFIACGFLNRSAKPDIIVPDAAPAEALTWKQRCLWMFLAFVPSSLMLGFTTYVTTDVASLPLLWVIPLALYLITFMIAFANKPLISIRVTRGIHAFFILCLLWLIMAGVTTTRSPIMILHAFLFFFTALLCHQELARTKPSPARLTEFYLFMSIGGALGGMFNSLLAPLIFKLPYEYLIAIVLGVFARRITEPNTRIQDAIRRAADMLSINSKISATDFLFFPGLIILGAFTAVSNSLAVNVLLAGMVVILAFNLHDRRWAFALTISIIILCKPLIPWDSWKDKLLVDRNFYGVHFVQDAEGMRMLKHGTTVHGAQARDTRFETIPITYYYMDSGIEDALTILDTYDGPQKIAALGLGAGSISCFFKGQRHFDFYEIDPDIVAIAENPDYFTYLSKCHSKYQIILGDARQEIAKAPDHSYDLIFVDVFSSDNIPLHILTKEAVALYKQKLKPNGMIVFHTSNRFFALEPEVAAIGQAVEMDYLTKASPGGFIGDTKIQFYPTKYVVLSNNPAHLLSLAEKKWGKLPSEVNQEPWSDDYANVLRALRF